MRPRFGLKPNRPMRNEILESAIRSRFQGNQLDEWKSKRQLRESQKFTYDTKFQDYNALADEDIGGVTELAVIKTNPNGESEIDTKLNGNVIIGGKEHKLDQGRLRVIDKKTVDENLGWIVEQRKFKDSIMSAIMSDRSGRICRMVLPAQRYNMLAAGSSTFVELFPGRRELIKQELIDADGRPEMFMLYHQSSKDFSLALHKLSLVIDNTELAFSEGIEEWNKQFGALSASGPLVSD